MKTLTLDILEKKRVYYYCKDSYGNEVKLKVTAATNGLSCGKQELLLKDVSVHTKWGHDTIYELEGETQGRGIITLQHRYNVDLVKQCRALGGRFDKGSNHWVFSNLVKERVERLIELYTLDRVMVELTAKEEVRGMRKPVYFLGYPVAIARNRDKGAIVGEYMSLLAGQVGSGGSNKNWETIVKAGAIFRTEVSRSLLQNVDIQKWDVRILEE
jgi:hypothetical protein